MSREGCVVHIVDATLKSSKGTTQLILISYDTIITSLISETTYGQFHYYPIHIISNDNKKMTNEIPKKVLNQIFKNGTTSKIFL